MAYDFTDQLKIDHNQAELERLRRGMDGCGCQDCQALYRTIDLEPYGGRVKHFQDIIVISAGAAVSNAADKPSGPKNTTFIAPLSKSPQSRFVTDAAPLSPTLEDDILAILKDENRPAREKSSRKIAKELRARGNFNVSYGTINRRINAIKEASHVSN